MRKSSDQRDTSTKSSRDYDLMRLKHWWELDGGQMSLYTKFEANPFMERKTAHNCAGLKAILRT